MTVDTPAVTAARIEVERRRGELLDTVHLLQARLAPRTLAADAWEKAKNKGADLAEDAVDAVKARPVGGRRGRGGDRHVPRARADPGRGDQNIRRHDVTRATPKSAPRR